jgi:hypothetical protein
VALHAAAAAALHLDRREVLGARSGLVLRADGLELDAAHVLLGALEAEVLRVVERFDDFRVARAVFGGQQRQRDREADAAQAALEARDLREIGVDPVAHGFPGLQGRDV